MSIKRNKKGQFIKGNLSGNLFTREGSLGNQHAKGNPPNKTSFKKGVTTLKKHPSWKGGVQHIKNDCVHLTIGTNKRVRRPRYIYEQVYGEIPKGYVIWHIDGNKDNDHISNLEAITRAEMVKRNNKRI